MKAKVLLAAFLGAVLVAAACAPKATPAPTPVAPAPTPAAPAPAAPRPAATPVAPAPTPVAAPAAKPTGELRIALGYLGVEMMDPSLGPATGAKPYLWPLYDYLVGADPYKGELSKDAGLARDWAVSHGPNSSTYTFYLRKGIKFHNGDEVTAADVKFSLEYFMRPKSVSTSSGLLRAKIDRIETPDPYKVVIQTKVPYAFLLLDLSPIIYVEGMVLPKKYIEEKGEDYFLHNPIGSGPYKFKEQIIGSYMRFEAQDQHWFYGVPRFKTLTFFIVPEETTRIAMLKTGQADIIEVSREQVKTLGDFNIFLKPGDQIVGMWLGNTWQEDTFLYNKKVREALNLAINREEILKFIFEGQGEVRGEMAYGNRALGYKPLPLYPYDPGRAKALLQEAFPGGVELTIDSYPRPGVPELGRYNEAVAGMWQAVGIKVKIVPLDYGSHRAQQKRGNLPNIASAFPAANRPLWNSYYRVLHHSTGILTLTKIPELDALIEALEGELDMNKVGERMFQVAKYLRENHLLIAGVETGVVFAANPKKITQWDMGKLMYHNNYQDLILRR